MNLVRVVSNSEPLNAIFKRGESTNYNSGTYRLDYTMVFEKADLGGGDWETYQLQESITIPIIFKEHLVAYLEDLYSAREDQVTFLTSDTTEIGEAIYTFAAHLE